MCYEASDGKPLFVTSIEKEIKANQREGKRNLEYILTISDYPMLQESSLLNTLRENHLPNKHENGPKT